MLIKGHEVPEMTILSRSLLGLSISLFWIHSTHGEISSCSRIDEEKAGTYHSLLTPYTVGKKSLLVCGSGDSKNLKTQNDFLVALAGSKTAQVLFSSDDAFKTYRITPEKSGVSIDESWARVNEPERYFIRTTIRCNQITCTVENQCIWKKTKVTWGKLLVEKFYAVLDGTQKKESLARFIDSNHGEMSEESATIQSDLARLRRANCLPN